MILNDLIPRVEAERALSADARETGAADQTLDGILRLLERARFLEERGTTPKPALDQVAHMVVDTFPMNSPLGLDLLRYAQSKR